MTENTNVPPPGSRAYQRGPHDQSVTPRDLKVQIKEQRLRIEWADGETSEYSLDELRKQCPCASCRTEREQKSSNPLKILKFDPSGVRVVAAELVGTYAIKFTWSDGHDTGIFDFRFLRALADGAT
jgi:DUF971 family protein